MKINPKEAISKAVSTAQETAVDLGGKAASGATEAARKASETVKSGKRKIQESLYNPVFPEDYSDPAYDRPKMIVIADGDERKGIDVCEGSIGWFGKAADLEVLHLYDEAVAFSGLAFFPMPMCEAAYFEDPLTPGRYINLDSFFDVIEKDKFTELRRIAYELGAKKCTLECYEEAKSVRSAKAGFRAKNKDLVTVTLKQKVKGKNGEPDKTVEKDEEWNSAVGGDVDFQHRSESQSQKTILFSQTFEGNAEPRRPELKWYAHDQEIAFLIDSRCGGESMNATKEYHVMLDTKASQAMSEALGAKVDSALGKLGFTCNFSLKGEALNESRKRLQFDIEF